MGPSHREPDAFTGPVGRNQSRSVWSRTCCSTLLSAGTIKTATHTHTNKSDKSYIQWDTQTQVTDLLYTNSSHGWFSGEAGLQVAQDFLHTLSKKLNHLFYRLTTVNVKNGYTAIYMNVTKRNLCRARKIIKNLVFTLLMSCSVASSRSWDRTSKVERRKPPNFSWLLWRSNVT